MNCHVSIVSLSTEKSSVVALAGQRLSVATWEKRFAPESDAATPYGDFGVVGDSELLTAKVQLVAVELEIVLEDGADLQAVRPALEAWTPDWLAAGLFTSNPPEEFTVNQNRPVDRPEQWVARHVSVLDLPISSLPSTRRRTRELWWGTRWLRVVAWQGGHIFVWYPVRGRWDSDRVPWPHIAIPSRTVESLRIAEWRRNPSEALAKSFADVMTHELYFSAQWSHEMEAWQRAAYVALSETPQDRELDVLRSDLGALSAFLSELRGTERALVRRVDVEQLGAQFEVGVASTAASAATQLESSIVDGKREVFESFQLLSALDQEHTARVADRTNRISERLSGLITLVTAVLIVPSIVVAVYGSNISPLSPGANGSLQELLLLMLGGAAVSAGVLRWMVRMDGRTKLPALALVGSGLLLVLGDLWIRWWGVAAVGVVCLCIGLLLGALAIASAAHLRKGSGAPSV